MFERPLEIATREYEFLRGREGADFFLRLAKYIEALRAKRRIRKVIRGFEQEVEEAAERTKAEQLSLIKEAQAIRLELARRAPEVDNSDMERPDDPMGRGWMEYDLDSFARFDELADLPVEVRYSPLPERGEPDATLNRLIGILRGRLTAAEYGEDPNGPQIRNDLDDLGRRIGNLSERHGHSVRAYRHDERTLVGLAVARLAYFGSDLNPAPTIVDTDTDYARILDQAIRDYGDPRTAVRMLVNRERLDEGRQRSAATTEASLKREAERLHHEVVSRLAPVPIWRPPVRAATVFAGGVATTVAAALILHFGFGIG